MRKRRRTATVAIALVLLLLPAAPAGALLRTTTSLVERTTETLLETTTSAVETTVDALGETTSALTGEGDPLLLEWSAVLPGFTYGYEPSSSNECKNGQRSCVERVIREMNRRLQRTGCDHSSLFGLAYLRTTEHYLAAWDEPGFFADRPFMNHYDAVFARFYFDAEDAWRAGRITDVDPAWRVAFGAADAKQVTSSGNMLLGMSAHINNDLPFTLAAIGLVAPDGTSRKADHDKVNQFLNRVTIPLREEVVARLDPAFGDSNAPGTLDETVVMTLIQSWREAAWRNAERLVNAPTEGARALIAWEIKEQARLIGESLRLANLYGPLRSSAARDAHCAVNGLF
jgi:hypothetical protein